MDDLKLPQTNYKYNQIQQIFGSILDDHYTVAVRNLESRGFSIKEISNILGVSHQMVNRRLARKKNERGGEKKTAEAVS